MRVSWNPPDDNGDEGGGDNGGDDDDDDDDDGDDDDDDDDDDDGGGSGGGSNYGDGDGDKDVMTIMMLMVILTMMAQIPEVNISKETPVKTRQTSPRRRLATLPANFSLTSFCQHGTVFRRLNFTKSR